MFINICAFVWYARNMRWISQFLVISYKIAFAFPNLPEGLALWNVQFLSKSSIQCDEDTLFHFHIYSNFSHHACIIWIALIANMMFIFAARTSLKMYQNKGIVPNIKNSLLIFTFLLSPLSSSSSFFFFLSLLFLLSPIYSLFSSSYQFSVSLFSQFLVSYILYSRFLYHCDFLLFLFSLLIKFFFFALLRFLMHHSFKATVWVLSNQSYKFNWCWTLWK